MTAAFEAWWQEKGQFGRAGGGEYEKTFAFNAWQAATAAERERAAKVCKDYANKHAKDDDDSKAQAWMMLQCAAAIRSGA
jgi:hypothetical protein